jgi:hypothetical protein
VAQKNPGSNQYSARRARSGLSRPTSDLLGQTENSLDQAGPTSWRCGEIWGTGCRTRVKPPDFAHGAHPAAASKQQVAWESSTPPGVLESLASDLDVQVRLGVAWNRNTPPGVLENLAGDPDADVRYWVAWNSSAPLSVLESLARDPDEEVRRGVAWNLSTPPGVLERLLQDEPRVATVAAGNPNLPAATLVMWQLATH